MRLLCCACFQSVSEYRFYMITPSKLMAIGVGSVPATVFAQALNTVALEYDITGRAEAAFVAQLAVESAMFKHLEENLNYTTASQIVKVFGSRCTPVMSKILGHPQALANFVYANRLGNGNEASGDGWRYRGRGLIMLTGFDNYYKYSYHKKPDQLMTSPSAACEVAGRFWHDHGCNQLALDGNDDGVTKAINGASMLDKDHRHALTLMYLAKIND